MEFAAIIVPLFLLAIGGAVVWISRSRRLIRRQVKRWNAPLPPLVVPTSAEPADLEPAGGTKAPTPAVEPEVEQVTAEPAQAEAEQRLETWGERLRSRSTPSAQ